MVLSDLRSVPTTRHVEREGVVPARLLLLDLSGDLVPQFPFKNEGFFFVAGFESDVNATAVDLEVGFKKS
jgi:hypothetical protein